MMRGIRNNIPLIFKSARRVYQHSSLSYNAGYLYKSIRDHIETEDQIQVVIGEYDEGIYDTYKIPISHFKSFNRGSRFHYSSLKYCKGMDDNAFSLRNLANCKTANLQSHINWYCENYRGSSSRCMI